MDVQRLLVLIVVNAQLGCMKRTLFVAAGLVAVSILLVILMFKDGKCQYGVFVRNETAGTVVVKYQTQVGSEGPESGEVCIGPGERGEVFQTTAFETTDGSSSIDPAHCTQVADYLVVYNQDDIRSIIEWCDPRIELIHQDIGQGTFELTVVPENFNPNPEPPE